MTQTTHLDLVKANFTRRQEIQGELRQIDEAATADKRTYTDDETAKVTGLREQLTQCDERLQANLEMEIRSLETRNGIEAMFGAMLDRDSGQIEDLRSIGQRFTDGDEYRQWTESGARGKFVRDMPGLEFRAVTDATTGSTSAGALTRPERLGRVGHDFLDRRVFLLDELQHIPITQGNIEYVQDQTPLADMANKPAEVAESGAKPQAGVTMAVISEAAATIAAWCNLTRQSAADIPQIQGYLDTRLRYGLKRKSDSQAINGTGVNPTLKGLLNRTGILTYAPGGAEARYKSIRHGIRLGEDAEAVYELIVLNPADAEIFDLSNDTTAGLHALDADGGIANRGPRTAWGLRSIRSTAIAAGTAMLLDPMAMAVFDRQEVTAYMTDSHASNFTSNILTLLLEARLGLGLFDPAGVCKITFNGTV